MVNCFGHSEIPANIIRRNYSPSRGWGSNLSLAIFHLVLFFRQNFSAEHQRDAWQAPLPRSRIFVCQAVNIMQVGVFWDGISGSYCYLKMTLEQDFINSRTPGLEKRENSLELKDNLGQGGSVTIGSKGRDAQCLYWKGWEQGGRNERLLYLLPEHLIVCHHQKMITRGQFYLTHIDF